MLNSIRKMLAQSGLKPTTNEAKSPYAVVERDLKIYEAKKAKKKKRKTDSKQLPSVNGRSAGTHEEIGIRTVSLPYIDSLMLVDESLKVAHYWSHSNTDKVALDTGHSMKSEIKALTKRFPRFCDGLHIPSFNTSDYKSRSDIWLLRTIEEAYDAVLAECIKPVSEARTRRRYDLELGAMDCFPRAVKRFLSRKYSVISEVLPHICIELLLALNRVEGTMDKVLTHRHIDGRSLSHAGRTMLFAQFLSEEFDVDKVAVYLHTRDVVQDVAGVKFRDLSVHVIHPITDRNDELSSQAEEAKKRASATALLAGHPFLDSTSTLPSPTTSLLDSHVTSSSQSHSRPVSMITEDAVDLIDQARIYPVKLPNSLRVLRDNTMPENPVLAIDLRSLTIICHRLCPRSEAPMRRYLFQKCMMWTDALVHMQSSMFKIMEHLQDPTVFDSCTFNGVEVDGLCVIPAHVVPWMVITEIGLYTASSEVTLPNDVCGDKPAGEVLASTEQGISVLNHLYDNNREKVHKADADVAAVEMELSQAKARILLLEKKKRRIERKWKEYTPDHSLTGLLAAKAEESKGYDLTEIAALRAEIAEAEEGR